MNNEDSTTNVECDITGSIESKNNPMLSNDITRGKISGIYKIINKINGKYYVGSSQNIKGIRGRWYDHRRRLNKNRHPNPHLQSSWNKYGDTNFTFVIIEHDIDVNKLLKIEQKYLDIAKLEQENCYNSAWNAECWNRGIPLSSKTKKKLSVLAMERFQIMENHPMYGKHHSNKTKEILKIKCSNPGRKNGRFDPKIYEFTNDNNGEIFVGTRYDFCRKYNIHSSRVSAIICKIGRSKRINGWSISLKPF